MKPEDAQDTYIWDNQDILPFTSDDGPYTYRLEARNDVGSNPPSSIEQLRREPIFTTGGLNEIHVSLGASILEFTSSATYTSQVTPIVVSVYITPKGSPSNRS